LAVSRADVVQGIAYLQIFRDGSLEYGDSYILNGWDMKIVPSQEFERKIMETFRGGLALLRLLEVPNPVYVSLTLMGVRGMKMSIGERSVSQPFDRDVIVCPDMQIQNIEEGYPYPTTLLPIVDAVGRQQGAARPHTNRTGLTEHEAVVLAVSAHLCS